MKRLTLLLVMLAVCGNAWAATNPLILRVPPRTAFAGNGLPVGGQDSSAVFSARGSTSLWITAQSRDITSVLPLTLAVAVRRHRCSDCFSDSTMALFPLRLNTVSAAVDTTTLGLAIAATPTTLGTGEFSLRFGKYNRTYSIPLTGYFGEYPGGWTSVKVRLLFGGAADESARVVVSVDGIGGI
jgi:hypothetical protein